MTSTAKQLNKNIRKYKFDKTENDENYFINRTKVSKIPTYNKRDNNKSTDTVGKLDLNSVLINNPDCTFLIKVQGISMINAGINTGDIILVDRSIKAVSEDIIVATINNELLVKRLKINDKSIELFSENDSFPTIKIKENDRLNIWGVVKSIIKQV